MQNKEYWIKLSSKFFEAETTEQEEQELRQFAATCQDPDFNELRAVMSYLEVARSNNNVAIRRKFFTHSLIAASLVLVMGISLFVAAYIDRGQDYKADYHAYVRGIEITDQEQVFNLMARTLQNMETISQDELPSVEEQLEDIFYGL
jgi:hypothetical protein